MAVQETSLDAYQDIRRTLSVRHACVLQGLADYHRQYLTWPTAYELYQRLSVDGKVRDLNDVRPRLTELAKLGHVETLNKRPCRVTQKRAFTWRLLVTPRLF